MVTSIGWGVHVRYRVGYIGVIREIKLVTSTVCGVHQRYGVGYIGVIREIFLGFSGDVCVYRDRYD